MSSFAMAEEHQLQCSNLKGKESIPDLLVLPLKVDQKFFEKLIVDFVVLAVELMLENFSY